MNGNHCNEKGKLADGVVGSRQYDTRSFFVAFFLHRRKLLTKIFSIETPNQESCKFGLSEWGIDHFYVNPRILSPKLSYTTSHSFWPSFLLFQLPSRCVENTWLLKLAPLALVDRVRLPLLAGRSFHPFPPDCVSAGWQGIITRHED